MKAITFLCAFAWMFASLAIADEGVRLINGKEVDPGTYKEVVRITSNGAGCTATVVGPRVIITAAHCASTGATATFSIDGTSYSAKMTRSPLYSPSKDHDVAVGLTSTDINVEPASIGGKANQGDGITLLGYGCTQIGGGGGNDGKLRIGTSAIVGFQEYDMVSRMANGAALCFGDSGGPAFSIVGTKKLLLGINSKGNIKDTNYNTRTDLPDSQTFLKNFAQSNSVKICGVTEDCSGVNPPQAPTCVLGANPPTVKKGQSVTLSLSVTGEATSANIDGQSISATGGQISVTTTTVGVITARGSVTGPGGSNSCQTTYTVQPDDPTPTAPSCSLAAVPNSIKLGEQLSLEIQTTGNVTSASIDGTSVNFPSGKRVITPPAKGSFTATGSVTGPGGSNNCFASYVVDDGTVPPNTPNFAVVPAYCGDNSLSQTMVRKVCLSVVKKEASMSLNIPEVLIITYNDGTQEVMPIISKRPRPKAPGDEKSEEDLSLYANGIFKADDYLVLDTRVAMLTKLTARKRNLRDVPYAIEGRSGKGHYFIVDKLSPFGVSK